MGHRHLGLGRGLGVAVAAGTLLSFAAAPGIASAPVAQATATALTVTVGGTPTDSGTFHASNDGTGQTTTGTNKPQVDVLTGQSLVSAGTLDQDASATIVNKEGRSRAAPASPVTAPPWYRSATATASSAARTSTSTSAKST